MNMNKKISLHIYSTHIVCAMSGSIKPAVLHFLVSQNCFKTPCYQTLPLYIISSNAAI